ncbi:hypothetical protein [Mycolicibacterium fluoranthenivorans]|jgi:hypothetical protein|uniref:Uncharacterized protein n=1 Tax=Mycolicibacterium fluoranthenivorans TaxID=258505 RepID=A0A1G4WRH1_9MYCO|nr:hypothetical protein [Mycolicibacterium fluoranthenivorans]SCX28038.1 hypothetical protein SAMN02799620_04503 [Mycolicibacterium fluoranthenivorans]
MPEQIGVPTGGDATAEDKEFTIALQQFASQLSPVEYAVLVAVLNTAMGPWRRMAERPADELLTPEECRLVDSLVEQSASKGHSWAATLG